MRFGICLSLWSKQDWDTKSDNIASIHTVQPRPAEQVAQSKSNHPASQKPKPAQPITDSEIEQAFIAPQLSQSKIGSLISDKQKGLVSSLVKEVADGDVKPIIRKLFTKDNLNTLTTKEGSDLIKYLMGLRKNTPDEQPF
jgi:hypothetical protein